MSNATKFDLGEFLPYRLNRAAEWASQRFAETYRRRYGMTRAQWRVLANLGQHGKLTATAICRLSALHKTKVSRAVAALETRHWLQRTRDETDRRTEWLELTPAGEAIFDDLSRQGEIYDAALVEVLGEADAAALKQGLAAIEALGSGRAR